MHKAFLTAALLATIVSEGCNQVSEPAPLGGEIVAPAPTVVLSNVSKRGLDQPEAIVAGPHGGEFIDLCGAPCRAELTHDWESSRVSIHVLDRGSLRAHPVEDATIELTVVIEDEVRRFTLTSDPEPEDPPGRSSRFSRHDKMLMNWYETPGMMARLKLVADHRECLGFIAGHRHRPVSEGPVQTRMNSIIRR